MQKKGKLFLNTDTTLSVSTQVGKEIENCTNEVLIQNDEALTIKRSKIQSRKSSITQDNQDNYDYKHQVTNFIREEVVLQHRPPKDSLSELVYLNNVDLLEKKLSNDNGSLNDRDNIGSTASWTPLYWGVKLGRTECVQLLLSYGVDINVVVNDCEECCGTVLDLATLRGDEDMENLLREFAEKEDVNLGQSFKAIRTKLRGKAPAFNFRYYGKNKKEEAA